MSLRGDPIAELSVPSGTTVEEHDLVTDGDVLVGGQSTVEFGVRGRNVAAGERASFGNDIEAEGDCRLDMLCDVDGNVLVGDDAYLGERVHITGRLMVSGDLDIGDDVDIEEGFEANGWIVIRNPVPTLVFYFIVLSQLLRLGEADAADDLAEALSGEEDPRDPLVIPRGAEVSDDAWRVSTPATIGDDCRLHGNVRAEEIAVGRDNNVFGSLRARGDITVGEGTLVHGDVTTRRGTVTVEPGAQIRGDVVAGDLIVHEGAEIEGTLRARGEMKLVRPKDGAAGGPNETDEADDGTERDEAEETDDGTERDETDDTDDGAERDEARTPGGDAEDVDDGSADGEGPEGDGEPGDDDRVDQDDEVDHDDKAESVGVSEDGDATEDSDEPADDEAETGAGEDEESTERVERAGDDADGVTAAILDDELDPDAVRGTTEHAAGDADEADESDDDEPAEGSAS
ncbi:hypothetical protein GCM10027435_26690 [Haloparvum alkalitolerans]|uniref:polymer-forming cytoskeletal protein n=1 Tax=Haloparvum alkalitolerans TaxID=1042953 RepID=UPI003CF959E8